MHGRSEGRMARVWPEQDHESELRLVVGIERAQIIDLGAAQRLEG